MGSGNKESDRQADVYKRSTDAYDQLNKGPSATETAFQPIAQGMASNYTQGAATNIKDYGNIMGGYGDYMGSIPSPTKFGYQHVTATRPGELNEAYSALRGALPGYQEFANTGGYSPTDIQELRARGTSPIRAAYGNTMMQLDRARALGGAGGSPNFIAAMSKAQRELPGQQATAMTDVNARLAEDIRSGKLAGLGGMTNVGGQMGQLSSAEAGRMLEASMSNQKADLTAQGMSEQSLQDSMRNRLSGLSGMSSLYGTTPGMASTFGNQAINAYGHLFTADQARNQYGLGLLDAQNNSLNKQSSSGTPWWRTALKYGAIAAPYVAAPFTGGASLALAPAAAAAGNAIGGG